jgi:hypothetical protein
MMSLYLFVTRLLLFVRGGIAFESSAFALLAHSSSPAAHFKEILKASNTTKGKRNTITQVKRF